MSHLQNRCLKISDKGRCEQRSEVFVKTFFFFFGGGGGGGGGSQGGCEQRIGSFCEN